MNEPRKGVISNLKGGMPNIFLNDFFDITLWAMVAIQLYNDPQMSPTKAIKNFCSYFNLNEDNAPLGSLQQSYYRKQKQFIEMMRAESGKITFHLVDERDNYARSVHEKFLKHIQDFIDPKIPPSVKVAMMKDITNPQK